MARRRLLGMLVALGCAVGARAVPARAQAPDVSVSAAVEASLGLAALHGGASWTASAAALLGLTPRLSVGGSGTLFVGTTDLAGSGPGSDLTLRTAFGGVVAQLRLIDRPDRSLWLRALAGVGNAKVDLSAVGTRIAADNFGVLVPEIGATLRIAGPLSAGAAAGYRAVFGVDDLPGVGPSDLRGITARVLLALRRR
jgi:hypothetical protein